MAADVGRATGLHLHVLDHDEEGSLTLLGVTGGRPLDHESLVIDVGGGSSEFVVARPNERPAATGLPIGASRLTNAIVEHDPPTGDELHGLFETARELVADAPEADPARIVVVGGTASNLVRVVPDAAADRAFTRRRIAAALVLFSVQTAAEIATHFEVRPMRARILPAGAAIMGAILERYGARRLYASDAGIREGAILAAARAGPGWRDALAEVTLGWS